MNTEYSMYHPGEPTSSAAIRTALYHEKPWRITREGPESSTWSVDAIERDTYVNAMGRAVTGVNIVTTDGPGGRFGLTVSAVSSVSADPPMLLVCINRHSPVCAALQTNQIFCVNMLSTHHKQVSDTFAGRPENGKPYDFACASWDTAVTGAPRLVDALSTFDCVLETARDAGSHTIFIGRVLEAKAGCGSPLLYSRRAYGRPQPLNITPGFSLVQI